VRIDVDRDGFIAKVTPGGDADDGERLAGPCLPGLPNLHSHAFQRAMAGLAERMTGERDSFWTWRETMYRFVARLTPDDVAAIAAQLYVEMLKAGYTAVGEFHYLHHDPDGPPYADRAHMSRRVIEVARATGMGITHLPVLYCHGGFGGKPAGDGQKRFVNSPNNLASAITMLRDDYAADPQVAIGLALHSLRAVTPEELWEAVGAVKDMDADMPIHIHAAEQVAEVEACAVWSGKRPVEWLLDNAAVDRTWCLVHATHMTVEETAALARSGAVAGLCPTTEANLGDGTFPLRDYMTQGGTFGIGSDSHISVNAGEELRLLEYGQRLKHLSRTTAASIEMPSAGEALYARALAGGRQALGRPIGRIEAGHRADWIVLDADHPALAGHEPNTLLDAAVFAAPSLPVRDVMTGGIWRVREGHHRDEKAVFAAFRRAYDGIRSRS
jgi:formimidoylglutamate deiminase